MDQGLDTPGRGLKGMRAGLCLFLTLEWQQGLPGLEGCACVAGASGAFPLLAPKLGVPPPCSSAGAWSSSCAQRSPVSMATELDPPSPPKRAGGTDGDPLLLPNSPVVREHLGLPPPWWAPCAMGYSGAGVSLFLLPKQFHFVYRALTWQVVIPGT